MSGQKYSHGLQVKAMLAAAAVAVSLGTPAFVGATSPPPPPPPPPAPAPQALNLDPSVHWFAAWDENTAATAPTDFFATPYAGNVALAQTQLNSSATASKPLGIKVTSPISAADATNLFNSKYPLPSGSKAISYVFADFESTLATMTTNTANLVTQVRNSTWSKNAYVGEFDLTPITGAGSGANQDPTRRGSMVLTKTQYDSTKVNMANTALYPGQVTFRNKATNDWGNANIRTGLFVGPIERMTAVQAALDSGYNGGDANALTVGTQYHKQIPWVTRFNNWGNSSLDTDNNAANGYKFVPGSALTQDGLSASQTANQMVGRGDFSAQILAYRMRGAYSVNAFAPGVLNQGTNVPYSVSDQENDIRYGWYGGTFTGNLDAATSIAAVQHANTIFAATDNKRATMSYNPVIDGTSDATGKRSEITGTIWSGVYSLSMGKLDVLEDNLDSINHQIKFGTVDVYDVFTQKNPSGYVWNDTSLLAANRNSLIEAGMHRLLQFDLVTTRVYSNSAYTGSYTTKCIWLLNQNYQVFTNNNRNDVGIPEPTTFGMLAAAGSMSVVCRRHRRNKEKQA